LELRCVLKQLTTLSVASVFETKRKKQWVVYHTTALGNEVAVERQKTALPVLLLD
jgi:hypothetical protein